MSDLSQVGAFILNVFVTLWDLLINKAGWLGIALIGFVVIRIVIFAVSFLLSHRGIDNKS
ncbi:hypothetical protein [Fusibacillus kribbianus]|uniref:Uncharacterized protein n=1 Tax=Fusibacillus kribbianus TaxID=3044208 RepID=A0AAP4BCR1_9FIRM|nr:hypothetical protein [Ruminococcus sp. YH-rum2234]MDI9242628.1 hypothetical protein [Ruminococcus sp. YH-rum2234]